MVLRFAVGVLLAMTLTSPAPADFRVVVQEAQVGRQQSLQVTPDGKFAWLVCGVSQHIVQIIDPAAQLVVRRYFLPERILSAWVDSKSRTLVVSTTASIHLGNLKSDELPEILPGVSGATRLSEGAELLAILGTIPDPENKSTRSAHLHARTLGVYELAAKRWRFLRATPVVVPALPMDKKGRSLDGPTALMFEETAVRAGGIGGSIGSMIPITFPVDVHLDLRTGKTNITTGPSARFGRPLDEKFITLAKGNEFWPKEENVTFRNDPKYQVPETLAKEMKHLAAQIERAEPDKLLEKLQFGENPLHDARVMPFVVRPGAVSFATQRFFRFPDFHGWHTAVLSLTKEGAIDMGPTLDTWSTPFGDGKRKLLRVEGREANLTNLVTGKPMAPPQALAAAGPKDLFFLSEGTLVQDSANLAFYRADQEKPVWTRKYATQKWDDVHLDARRETVALLSTAPPILARVLRLSDGELLGEIPSPIEIGHYFLPMALSADGMRLAVIHEERMCVFDVESAKQVETHLTAGDRYHRGLLSWSGGWLLGGYSKSHLFDDKTNKWRAEIDFPYAAYPEEIDTPLGKRLLLQNSNGQCGLLNPENGKVLMRWFGASDNQHRPTLWSAVFAQGRALVRSTGWNATLDVIDLRDLSVVLTIHNVPIGKKLGWIAFTPDGYWNASEGAERPVAVFRDDQHVEQKDRIARRRPDVIQKRLADLWR